MANKRGMCLVLITICLLVYANSLNNGFIADDIPGILENPSISEFSQVWLSPAALFNSLNYLIAKFHPFVYHLTNVIFHTIDTILVFFFLSLFFKTKSSFLAACLFAVHPIHTEAVNWISARPYLFLAFFILATYLLYCRATGYTGNDKKLKSIWYILSLFPFLYFIIGNYGFFSFFPLLLILSDVTFGKWRKNWKCWLPFLVIVILRLVLARGAITNRISFMKETMGAPTIKSYTYFVYSLYTYLGLLIWPAKLTLFREGTIIPQAMLNHSVFYLIPIVLALFFTFKKAKEIFFGLSIFILFLAPTYSPIPISCLAAERYAYFPSVALSMFIAFLYERYSNKYRKLKGYLLAVLILLIAIYGVRTILRNRDWRDPATFWKREVLVSPTSWQVHNNVAFIYLKEGDAHRAIEEYKKALQIRPGVAETYNNLGVAYSVVGEREKAIVSLEKATEIDPQYTKAYYNLGKIYSGVGENKKAVAYFKKALESDSSYAPTHFNLSVVYLKEGEFELAAKHCDEAIRLGYVVPYDFLKSLLDFRKK